MLKKSKKLGNDTSVVEIQVISKFGFWIFVNDQEFFVSFDEFPWFQKATINQIYDFQFYHGRHLYWPILDIDVSLESLKYPEKYPLISKIFPVTVQPKKQSRKKK